MSTERRRPRHPEGVRIDHGQLAMAFAPATLAAAVRLPRLPQTRYDELRRGWLAFDAEHPKVWRVFQELACAHAAAGHAHWSVNGIFEILRWHTDLADEANDHHFKMNNNYRPFYARRFNDEYPQLGNGAFFRLRDQTSQEQPPANADELEPHHFDGYRAERAAAPQPERRTR